MRFDDCSHQHSACSWLWKGLAYAEQINNKRNLCQNILVCLCKWIAVFSVQPFQTRAKNAPFCIMRAMFLRKYANVPWDIKLILDSNASWKRRIRMTPTLLRISCSIVSIYNQIPNDLYCIAGQIVWKQFNDVMRSHFRVVRCFSSPIMHCDRSEFVRASDCRLIASSRRNPTPIVRNVQYGCLHWIASHLWDSWIFWWFHLDPVHLNRWISMMKKSCFLILFIYLLLYIFIFVSSKIP
jgi:hypothetical protein